MYIGPWQEFKLARILQLKDKLDKEQEEEDRYENRHNPVKAFSEMHRIDSFAVETGQSDYS